MGSNVHVEWVSKGRFVGTDGHKHSIVMSTQDAENGIGMKPSELLLVALGGCSSVHVVSILQKKRQTLTGLEVEITRRARAGAAVVLPQDQHHSTTCAGAACRRRRWPTPSACLKRNTAR